VQLRCRFLRITCCVLAAAALSSAALATQTTRQLAPGISLFQDINTAPGSQLIVSSVTIDPKTPGISVKAAIGKDTVYFDDPYKGRESIGTLTQRRGAFLGINADYFPWTGDPSGLCVVDGELVSEPVSRRAVVAILADGSAAFDNPTFDAKLTLANNISRQIDGINRDRETNQVLAYASIFGTSTQTQHAGTEVVCSSEDLPVRAQKTINLTVTEVRADAMNTPIPKGGIVLSAGGPAASFLNENLKPGDKFTIRFDIKSANGTDWTQAEQAVSGGPWLLKDGKQFIDLETERMGATFSAYRHPRTAVGLTSDGKLILVTVDGRQSISRGISLPDLSVVMKRLGATNAINLDGGGSTTLSYRGIVVNSPSDGEQRSVADALLVFADTSPTDQLPNLAIAGIGPEVATGQATQLSLTYGDDARPVASDAMEQVVWGTANGGGFVNQQGVLTPVKLRRESVKAFYGTQLVGCDVKVVAGAPVKLSVALVPDKQNPLLARAVVTLVEADENPCAGRPVTLTVTGGKADVESGASNDKGQFAASIAWDASATDRSVKATSGDLTATWPPAASTPTTAPDTSQQPANTAL